MSKESSFDVVSKVEMPEVTNAISIALKEIQTRYDFKGSKSEISLDKEELVLVSDDDYKLEQLKDVSCIHIISTTGNEAFYRKQGFRKVKTGMARYLDSELTKAYLE